MRKHCAQLAQLVEQRTENPCVSGSIPELGILIYYGILAQVVEHLTFNQVVRGSNPRCLIRKRKPSLVRVMVQTVDKVLRETSVSRSIFLCVYEIYSENRKFSLGLCHP